MSEFEAYRDEIKKLVGEQVDWSALKPHSMGLVEMVINHSYQNRKKAPAVAKRLLRSLEKYGRKE